MTQVWFQRGFFYAWRSKHGGMDFSEAQRLKTLESENHRLKKLLAEAHLDIEVLQVVARGKR
jgi:putative transposase